MLNKNLNRIHQFLKIRRNIQRRKVAKKLIDFKPAFSIDPNLGYSIPKLIDCFDLNSTVAEVNEEFIRWRGNKHAAPNNKKPYLQVFKGLPQLSNDSASFRLATHPKIIRSVVDYLGVLPYIWRVDMWWCPPVPAMTDDLSAPCSELKTVVDSFEGSQLFHLDSEDESLVKLWIFASHVKTSDGPTLFFPSRLKTTLKKASSGVKRVNDEIFEEWSDQLVVAVGPEQTSYAVDTANCYHCGSRNPENGRLALMVEYVTPNARYFLGDEKNTKERNSMRWTGDRSLLSELQYNLLDY